MNSGIKKGIVAAVTAVAAAMALTIGTAGTSSAAPPVMQAVGITPDGLTMAAFHTNTPDVLDWVQDIQGLDPNTYAIGLDWRVKNNTLYLVGSNGSIYTVAVPTSPGQPVIAVKVSKLTETLYGTFFGVDFNPAADRLRIISDNGQNLSHDVDGHVTTPQQNLNQNNAPAKGITAACYSNNDLHPDTNTTLFDIDTPNDTVVIQSPPPTGTLVATGKLTVDAGINAGCDIWSALSNGKTVANFGFGAFLAPDGTSTFYFVELLTGMASPVGKFPSRVPLSDIALPLSS